MNDTAGISGRPPPGRDRAGGAVATAFLAAVLVILHVVIDPTAYDVSQMPRLLVLLAGLLVAVPAVAFVPPLARRLEWRPLGEPTVVAAAAFLVATILSLAAALNVSAGFTDVFRTLGAFLVLCLCLLLLPLQPLWRRRLLQAAVAATLVAVAVGCFELRHLLGLGLPSRRDVEMAFLTGTSPLDGMMSNVNLFAGQLLLILPWCVCAVAELRGPWRWTAAAATSFVLAMLVVLQCRAAWLALAVAALLAGVTILRHGRQVGLGPGLRKVIVAGLAGGVAAAVGVAALACTDTATGAAIRRLTIARPHQQGGPVDGGRTMVWCLTGEMIAAHPLLGVGAGNFPVRMHEHLRPAGGGESRDFSNLASDEWDHPHNDFLEVFAEHGLPGFAAFVAVFILALAALRRVLTGDPPATDARLATASLAALAAYLVLSCLDFPLDRVSHQVVLAVHLAVIVLLDRAARPVAAPASCGLPGWLVVPPVAAGLLLGIAYAAAAVAQERAVQDVLRARRAGDWPAMLMAARRAATPWKSLDHLDVPVALHEGLAERCLGRLPEATACFERAFAAHPNRLEVLDALGNAYAQQRRLDDAIDIFAIAADRYDYVVELRHNLAMALIDAERFAEAGEVLEDVPEPLRTETMREALAFVRARQASSLVTGTVVLPAELASFADRLLEIRLYRHDPRLADAPAELVDVITLPGFAHEQGTASSRTFAIGGDKPLDPGRSHYLTCFILDGERRTHIGEPADGGLCRVLTEGHPRDVTLTVRAVR